MAKNEDGGSSNPIPSDSTPAPRLDPIDATPTDGWPSGRDTAQSSLSRDPTIRYGNNRPASRDDD